ncbi:MAG: hypothetical protein PUP46_09850 [Endozoicomonas sp. (ex Botrylloides leachii)]|nr:hypothetical protein [Endozoicomonas sp. (ex Botrylloides leachii)]
MTEKTKTTARFLKRKMAEHGQFQVEIEQLKAEMQQAEQQGDFAEKNKLSNQV